VSADAADLRTQDYVELRPREQVGRRQDVVEQLSGPVPNGAERVEVGAISDLDRD
jgi:hypothetical protein